MKTEVVGPYVIEMIKIYNMAKEGPVKELTAQALMSRASYRACLEANYPELYKELKEIDFLYIKRD